MLRLRPNCRVMRVEPTVLCEVISVTSAMTPRWRSSGVATVVAIVSGLAPGIVRKHRDRREIDLRQRRHRQLAEREEPGERDADRQQRRRDRPLDERRRRVHRTGALGLASLAPKRRRAAAAEPVEAEIDDRRREQGQHLAEDQPADDRDPERMAQLRAGAGAEHQRQRAEQRRHGRHQDRAEAQAARPDRSPRAATCPRCAGRRARNRPS